MIGHRSNSLFFNGTILVVIIVVLCWNLATVDGLSRLAKKKGFHFALLFYKNGILNRGLILLVRNDLFLSGNFACTYIMFNYLYEYVELFCIPIIIITNTFKILTSVV